MIWHAVNLKLTGFRYGVFSDILQQGIGNARLCMILGILDGVICRVLLSYFMGVTLKLGFYGFVLEYSLATFANGIPSMWALLRGDWGSRQAVI